MTIRVLFMLSLCLAASSAMAERGENLLRDAGFEEKGAVPLSAWEFFGKGYEVAQEGRGGGQCIRCSTTETDQVLGAKQVIQFDPPVKHPFLIEGWSKCEGVGEGGDYSVFLDVFYEDGTPLWGQRADFSRRALPAQRGASGEWQKASKIFDVEKPVARISVFALFRRQAGTVWFDDIRVSLAPFDIAHVRLSSGLYGGSGLDIEAETTLPADWTIRLEQDSKTVQTSSGNGLIRGSWTGLAAGQAAVVIEATDVYRQQTVRKSCPVLIRKSGVVQPCVWTMPSTVRAHRDDYPDSEPEQPAISLSLARNEYESGQLLIRTPPGMGLQGASVLPGDLKSETGAILPAANIEWLQVSFVWIEKQFPHPLVKKRAPCWWPDPLLPVTEFDMPENITQPIWITVYAPPDQPPGLYTGSLRVADKAGWRREVALRVRVWDFAIPVKPSLKTAFALMDGFLEKLYGKPLTPELRQAYGDYLLKHRLNPDDISRTDPPAIEDLLHYRERGLNTFNVLNMVKPRGDHAWVCWSPPDVYTPAFKQGLIQRLDPYVAELRKHSLSDMAYVYTFDERPKEFFPIIKEYFGMIKERYPEIHTLTTAKVPQDPEAMADLNVDWNCPVTRAYRFEEAEKVRAAGRQVWAYICLGPRYPYANWLADDPLIEARAIWWQVFHQKMDGFLYWGLNIWGRVNNDHIIRPGDGPLLKWSITTAKVSRDTVHGDGILLYPGEKGPIGCIRLANIRDGLEDYEYLVLLSKKLRDLETARRSCEPVTTSLTLVTRDANALMAQREAIAEKIQGR